MRNIKFFDNEMSLNVKGIAMILIVINHTTLYMTNKGFMIPFLIIGYMGSGIFLFVSGYGCMYPALETRTDFFFSALSLLIGASPAHEQRCFAVGKTSIFTPISDIKAIAVNMFLKDGAVKIRSISS